MMDFTSLAGALLKAGAPILGGALGGPGGAAVGSLIVGTIAPMLGLSEDAPPEEIARAIEAAPDAAQIVQQAEAKIGKTVQEIELAIVEAVNQTSRAELQSESRFVKFARPFNIWMIGIVTGGYGVCLVASTAQAVFLGNSSALGLLVSNAGVIGVLLAPCGAVAGVTAWGRTKEKIAGAESVVTGAISAIVKKATK